MEEFTVGIIVLVAFPFSNLKGKKIRPALVLAHGEFNNLILCQITSKPYSSKSAIRIESVDFKEGELPLTSYVRPNKLFTADTSIIKKVAGKLNENVTEDILQKVQALFS